MKNNILKLDLDLKNENDVFSLLIDRLNFLKLSKIFDISIISKIELIKKNNYSCKIYLKKSFKEPIVLILFQSLLGGDYKHIGITYRDYKLNIKNWNRLFNIKRYSDGTYKFATQKDITKQIFTGIENLTKE